MGRASVNAKYQIQNKMIALRINVGKKIENNKISKVADFWRWYQLNFLKHEGNQMMWKACKI